MSRRRDSSGDVPVCHVVGAGLAGLSAACKLVEAGLRVRLYEAAPQAGGRCRSLPDQRFGTAIDNGAHVLMTGNRAALSFLRSIGAPSTALEPLDALEFRDLDDGSAWRIRPAGESAAWMLGRGLAVPGVPRWRLLWEGMRLLSARDGSRTGECLSPGGLAWRRLWRPFLKTVFNAEAAEVSAPHAAAVLKRLFSEGAASGRVLLAARPWSEIAAEPATAFLRHAGAEIAFGAPLLALERGEGRARRLIFRNRAVDTGRDLVILAVPNAAARRLCPDFVPALPHAPILNLHFETPEPLGLGFRCPVGGLADAVFWRGSVVSVTIGGATADGDPDALAAAAWAEAAAVLPRAPSLAPPPWRRIVEKRATVAATPEAFALRPDCATPEANLFLAGDWTATGLPSTIEGAVVSGRAAAKAAIAAAIA